MESLENTMGSRILDPTAGERARLVRLHPEVRQPVLDPTDVRCGSLAEHRRAGGTEGIARLVVDPTDPACQRSAV